MSLCCNFCFKAGRDDFNSHNVRDSRGKLTCKYLADIECRYCHEMGHTISRCDVLKKKNRNEAQAGKWGQGRSTVGNDGWVQCGTVCEEVDRTPAILNSIINKINNPKNPFDVLADVCEDSDDSAPVVATMYTPGDYIVNMGSEVVMGAAVGNTRESPRGLGNDSIEITGIDGSKVTINWGRKSESVWSDECE